MISNEEAFAKADFAARQLETEIQRRLTSDEYETYVIRYISYLQNPYLQEPIFETNFGDE